ncbi:MAG: ABC transporter ATP-binding protein [Bacillota bacterium]
MNNRPLIQLRGITKRFPGVLANDRVDLDLYAGEIHALLGENGSGKSTLMSVLAGLYRPDAGQIIIAGQEKKFRSPRDAIACGIGMVHQHFKLVEPFTVAENIILGERGRGAWLSPTRVRREIQELAARYGLEIDPQVRVWQLSVGEKQRVEIVRMLYRGMRVLILDEPTAVLTPQEAGELFANLKKMAADGCAVVLITHKLNEVQQVADRITVLRGGRVTGVLTRDQINPRDLAWMMVGRDVVLHYDREPGAIGKAVLQLEGVSALNDMGRPGLQDVSLTVHQGEILGLAGVSGNGQRELAEVVAGLRPAQAGRVLLDGRDVTGLGPRQMTNLGVSYVPEDRLGMGLVPDLGAVDNLILKQYYHPAFAGRFWLKKSAVLRRAAELVEKYQVKLASLHQPVKMLSGGNLQRLLLAREISAGPRLMVVMYPARGLDIGATEVVHRLLLQLKERGTAILLISEDLDEIFKLADRVGVLYNGKIVGQFAVEHTDLEEVGLLMMGSRPVREGGEQNDELSPCPA